MKQAEMPYSHILAFHGEIMKAIGMIGGMSWESSLEYYRLINEFIKEQLGGLHSAKCLLYSVDFAEIEELQMHERWREAALVLSKAAMSLEKGGADFIVLCTNTMHKVADEIQSSVSIPFLHITDAVAGEIKGRGLKKIGLLGTRFTMEEDFYKTRLIEKHGLEVIVPEESERTEIHRVIYEELVLGKILENSREVYHKIIGRLAARGAEGIILGCTEIGLLVKQGNSPIPLFDSTQIHARAAVTLALEK
jgi:aspartate racemase